MDQDAYLRCLAHLESAEQCMVESIDGWHLARLSTVVGYLREAYEPGDLPSAFREQRRSED